MVQTGAKTRDPISKITKAKRSRGVAQVVVLPSKSMPWVHTPVIPSQPSHPPPKKKGRERGCTFPLCVKSKTPVLFIVVNYVLPF
jgi:hypothetical protein